MAKKKLNETLEPEDIKVESSKPKKPIKKTYRGPTNHVIGNRVIEFVNGFYSTEDPAKQKLIESDLLFGTKICEV